MTMPWASGFSLVLQSNAHKTSSQQYVMRSKREVMRPLGFESFCAHRLAGWLGVARNGTAIHSLSGKRPPQKGLLKNGADGGMGRAHGWTKAETEKAAAAALLLHAASGCPARDPATICLDI